ncbi:NmrA family NAD(P)-binding protein [Bosea sp. (in: a-proteobacteria)]|uniref:NmrA family NAD(P)-binding protein n=1 Tax=Bosea sp. (in: a-proteobacteria) TaxID=1871050 RepID=UPI002DDD2E19|nr:NmrA family NAD(P)-binding protein [Bosea sp. (in: a-proteobacteria)]HEV2509439.1 NmrA family NAD(P)-binding protein [Bosea sp. (in: a-proteobacteria)]
MMLAIMGATGQTGGAALTAALAAGHAVKAIVREPNRAGALADKGAALAKADLDDVGTLTAAFAGTDAVYVLNPVPHAAGDVFAAAAKNGAMIAEAIRRAGVPHVVALSSSGAHRAEGTGIVRALHDFEQALRGAAPSLTFIRATEFMENWGSVLGVAAEHGILPSMRQPLDTAGETVSAIDVGRQAAVELARPHAGERIVNLKGPAEYSPEDAAQALTELLGKPVLAVATPRQEWEPGLIAAGLSASHARELAGLYDAMNAGRASFEEIGETRRGSVSLKQALAGLLA